MIRSLASRASLTRLAVGLAAASLVLGAAGTSEAQIKRPGAHPRYDFELEPHLLLQWTRAWGDEGIGVGARANIPLFHNGPIDSINNNMAVGFGLDWVHFDDICNYWWRWYAGPRPNVDCSADVFWAPVVLQWNFWLTDMISVFGEPGLAIEHARWDYEFRCGPGGAELCRYKDSDTDLEFVFFAGARFMFGDTVGMTVRLGTPYISLGVNFLL
ncbi:MAG: hypothetical protein KF718_16545 [Polyangiaceae bacterium]|nr:hypothetical protein [Polyangiaceae bacterium]